MKKRKTDYFRSLLCLPGTCMPFALTAMAVLGASHGCLTWLPHTLLNLMLCVYTNSVGGAHFTSSKSTSIPDLIFLLVCIVDNVLDLTHCALYAVEGWTVCCSSVYFEHRSYLWLEISDDCGSFQHSINFSNSTNSTDLIDKENCSSHYGILVVGSRNLWLREVDLWGWASDKLFPGPFLFLSLFPACHECTHLCQGNYCLDDLGQHGSRTAEQPCLETLE